MTLEEIKNDIYQKCQLPFRCFIEGDELIVEDEYEMTTDEKNSDDCCDIARENGEFLVEQYQMLEISDYYCHRNKYAIVKLKLK